MQALVYTNTQTLVYREEKNPIEKSGESILKIEASGPLLTPSPELTLSFSCLPHSVIINKDIRKNKSISELLPLDTHCKYVHGKYHEKLYFLKYFYTC